MTIRVSAPHGHNDTTEKFRRTSHEGRLCFGDDCKATEVHKFAPVLEYVVYALLAVLLTWFIVHSLAIVPHNIPVIEETITTQITPCPAGQTVEWLDSTTITCHKETR